MKSTNCTLSILVARTDIPFMLHTIPHLVKQCRFHFSERVLVIDTAPLSASFQNRPGIGTLEQLYENCQKLLTNNIVDRLVDINYSKSYRQEVYKKHFGQDFSTTHDFRGYPILGSLFAIESATENYVVHFDSDMLLYQHPDYSWIQAGIECMQKHPDIMFVSPLSGPPTRDGTLKQRETHYSKTSNGYYRFTDFTSRKFLVDRQRLEAMLPLDLIWISWKRRLASRFTGKSALWSWEFMISNQLKQTGFIRADLDSSHAWTLHTPDHGSQFIQSLPQVIQKIESGHYPPIQAGDYDLQLEAWI